MKFGAGAVIGRRLPKPVALRVKAGLYSKEQVAGTEDGHSQGLNSDAGRFLPGAVTVPRGSKIPLGTVFRIPPWGANHVVMDYHDATDERLLIFCEPQDFYPGFIWQWIEILGSLSPLPESEAVLLAALDDFCPLNDEVQNAVG